MITDIPRLYTAIAEWSACAVYILIMKKRYLGIKLISFMSLFLLLQCGLQLLNGRLPLFFWIPGMIAAVVLMYITIYACCKISIWDAGVCSARAFVLAEFTASFEWQVFLFFSRSGLDSLGVSIAFVILFFSTTYSVVFILEGRHMPRGKDLGVNKREFFSSALITLAVFLMSNISFIYKNTPFSGEVGYEILYIRTLVDFSGFVMLFAQQEKWQELHSRQELSAINRILNQQFEQYQMSRENIELLNQKYHDLKHQINIIRAESDPDKKEAYLEEMETSIKIYEAQNITGNHVLDTILTGKSMNCVQKDINFTCVADGKLLSFMNVMDICSIFGNMLDNAIESVMQLEDKSLRLIRLAVFSQNNFLMIRVENYSKSELTIVDGIPVTTKSDKHFHGYGIKSIQYVAEKYEGTMTINHTDNWFTLRILIPLPKKF